MTRSRSFNRSQRWTAKLRRRHLRASLPPIREGEPISPKPGADLRRHVRERDQLKELLEFESDPGWTAES
jgi:hypothetical protein